MTRPTDNQTGQVVAEKEGWDEVPHLDLNFGTQPFFYIGEETEENCIARWCRTNCLDPRDDTDTALELLHWIVTGHVGIGLIECDAGWCVGLFEETVILPISGQALRYAIVNLAIKVMEIKDD